MKNNHIESLSVMILRQVLFDIRAGNSNLAESLGETFKRKKCSILISIDYNTLFITGFYLIALNSKFSLRSSHSFHGNNQNKSYNQIGVTTVGSRQNSVRTIGTLSL